MSLEDQIKVDIEKSGAGVSFFPNWLAPIGKPITNYFENETCYKSVIHAHPYDFVLAIGRMTKDFSYALDLLKKFMHEEIEMKTIAAKRKLLAPGGLAVVGKEFIHGRDIRVMIIDEGLHSTRFFHGNKLNDFGVYTPLRTGGIDFARGRDFSAMHLQTLKEPTKMNKATFSKDLIESLRVKAQNILRARKKFF